MQGTDEPRTPKSLPKARRIYRVWQSTRELAESYHGRSLSYERRGDGPTPPGPDAGAGSSVVPAASAGLPVHRGQATRAGKAPSKAKAANPKGTPVAKTGHGGKAPSKTPEQVAKADA